jgi:hypothetical protein
MLGLGRLDRRTQFFPHSLPRRLPSLLRLHRVWTDLDVAYKCMLQQHVSSVLGVSYICCKCFIWMLHMFCNGYTRIFQVFFGCFASVSDVCCKCFSCFRTYVASVSSKGYKSKLGVVHVVIRPTYHSRLLQLLGRRHGSPCGRLTQANASIVWHAQAGAVIRTHVDFCVRARWSGETKQARW